MCVFFHPLRCVIYSSRRSLNLKKDKYPSLGRDNGTNTDGCVFRRDGHEEILTDGALAFVKKLHRLFGPDREYLLEQRKLFTRQYHDGGQELYDHGKDPNEWTNLAGSPAYEEVITELKTALPEINRK